MFGFLCEGDGGKLYSARIDIGDENVPSCKIWP